MNLIWISKRLGEVNTISIGGMRLFTLALSLFIVLPAMTLFTGYYVGLQQGVGDSHDDEYVRNNLSETFKHQQDEISTARVRAEEGLNALALRLGQMQAHVVRLDAVGQRLVSVGDLDGGEFNFSKSPALGGPESGVSLATSLKIPDF
ncbi:MAG: hypothetical protein GQ470_06305, partial [Gammaproteobacteria bacterium]|nr:hypothetical protein [Gammaproteobacteria bacterium]